MNEFWVILTAFLVASVCGALGVFLILRKMAMVADAISHSVLPGIVVAYLFTGDRSSVTMLPGAIITGILVTFLVEKAHKTLKIQTDAAIGIVFTALFAVGVILVTMYAGQIDLDQECVLYGDIVFVPFDTLHTGSFLDLMPRPVWILLGLVVVITIFLLTGFKRLVLTSFDPLFAAVGGISVAAWHYAFMSLVSVTAVVSFESVGAILVLALMVVPPATAYLLTTKIRRMFLLTFLAGAISAVGGYYFSVWLQASVAASMATVSGILFLVAWGISLRRRKMKAVH